MVDFAVFSHENLKLLLKAFSSNSLFSEGLFKTFNIEDDIESLSFGSINMQESPVTSGIEVILEVITAHLHFIASKGGKPKPSYKEG